MVAHSQEFGFLTDIEVITQVLLIGSFIQTIDKILLQFTSTIGCNLMNDLNIRLAKEFSAMIRSIEHKGEIVLAEGFLIVPIYSFVNCFRIDKAPKGGSSI